MRACLLIMLSFYLEVAFPDREELDEGIKNFMYLSLMVFFFMDVVELFS